MVTYETNLLDPIWWINSLLGNWFLAIAIVQLWLLSYIRKIPNITTMSFILIAINGILFFYGIFVGEGITIGTSLMALVMLIWALIAWSGYNNS